MDKTTAVTSEQKPENAQPVCLRSGGTDEDVRLHGEDGGHYRRRRSSGRRNCRRAGRMRRSGRHPGRECGGGQGADRAPGRARQAAHVLQVRRAQSREHRSNSSRGGEPFRQAGLPDQRRGRQQAPGHNQRRIEVLRSSHRRRALGLRPECAGHDSALAGIWQESWRSRAMA